MLMQNGTAGFPAYGTPLESQPQAPSIVQPNPNLAISEEIYQKLKRIIDSNIEKPFINTGKTIPHEETRLKLNAVIRTIGGALNAPVDVESIKTPQELADRIAGYYESRGAARIDAVCVDISLLVNELIKRYLGADSSILIFHPVDKDGLEYAHGHATAAILFNGWLVDPALQNEAIHFDHIILDRQADGYKPFYAKLKEKYSSVEGGQLFSNCVFIEFSQVKSDSELQAFYLLENAARMKSPEHGTQEESDAFYLRRDAAFIEAYKLDPGNYYAAINAGDAYKHAGDTASARRAYLSAAAHNANLYLATSRCALSLSILESPPSTNDLSIAYKMIHNALDAAKKEGCNLPVVCLYQSEIARKLGYTEESREAYERYLEYSRKK